MMILGKVFSGGFRLESISFPLRRKTREFSVGSNIIHLFCYSMVKSFHK